MALYGIKETDSSEHVIEADKMVREDGSVWFYNNGELVLMLNNKLIRQISVKADENCDWP